MGEPPISNGKAPGFLQIFPWNHPNRLDYRMLNLEDILIKNGWFMKSTQLIAVGKTRFYILVGNRTFSPNFIGHCSGMVKAKTEHQWSVAWHPSKWHRTIWSKKKRTPFNICVNVAHGIGFAAPDANCVYVCVFFARPGQSFMTRRTKRWAMLGRNWLEQVGIHPRLKIPEVHKTLDETCH